METATTNPEAKSAVPPPAPAPAAPVPPPRLNVKPIVVGPSSAKVPPKGGRRMTLGAVTTGVQVEPFRLLVGGVDGVGKSTFAAGAPKAVFIPSEDGTHHLATARFPLAGDWLDIREAVQELTESEHDFQTAVIDTADACEPLLYDSLCREQKWDSIEAPGYGKGYTLALDRWRLLLGDLERLQAKKKMNVILLAHSVVKKFSNPTGEDYDRWILKMHDRSAALLREWSHAVYFAHFETYAMKEKRKVLGVSTGARLLATVRTAAWDAKDRYGLPETISLDWSTFEAAAAAGRNPDVLKARLAEGIPQLTEALRMKAEQALTRAADDCTKLAQLDNWVRAQLLPLQQPTTTSTDKKE